MYAFLLARKVMKKTGEITNYRRRKREMCAKTEFAFTSRL